MADGTDMVVQVTPMFVLDFIITPSGSKSYAVPSGRSLMTMRSTYRGGQGSTSGQANVSVSGNTVTWSNASAQQNIVVYAG